MRIWNGYGSGGDSIGIKERVLLMRLREMSCIIGRAGVGVPWRRIGIAAFLVFLVCHGIGNTSTVQYSVPYSN